jgi:4-carboxymuconolactone decarboxylase
MTAIDYRYRVGVEILQRLLPQTGEPSANKVAEVAPDFARMAIEFPFGDLFSRGAVDLPTRLLAAVATLAALGRVEQLRLHVGAALRVGCTRDQLVETLMQTAIYAGFPAALDALAQCHDLLTGNAQADGSAAPAGCVCHCLED